MTMTEHPPSFDVIYTDLLRIVYRSGVRETNSRTGVLVSTFPGGVSFRTSLLEGKLPTAGNRRYYPRVAAAEVAWQFMGTQNPNFMLTHAPKLWQDFIEDGKITGAYGYRWREHFGRDQLQLAVDELCVNPTNRQLYISAWDPATDGLGGPQSKNVPCPVGFSLSSVDDHVHASVFLRSSDLFVGLPYDVMAYALTVDAIAASVNQKPGHLHFTLAHAHIYEPHFEMVEQCLSEGHTRLRSRPPLPAWAISEILREPSQYVQYVERVSQRALPRHEYDPKPELVV